MRRPKPKTDDQGFGENGTLLPPTIFPATSPAYLLILHNGMDGLTIEHLPVVAWTSQTASVGAPAGWFTGLYPITPGMSGIPAQHISLPCHVDWCILHGMLTAEAVLDVARELVVGAIGQLCYDATTEGVHYVVADELEDTTPSAVMANTGAWHSEDDERAETYAMTARQVIEMIQEAEDWTIDTVPLTPRLRAEMLG